MEQIGYMITEMISLSGLKTSLEEIVIVNTLSKIFLPILQLIIFIIMLVDFPNEYTPILLFTFFWLNCYSHALIVAEIDNDIISTKMELTLWEKRLLFPFQPNKFNKKTVIAQRIWTYYAILVIIIYLFTLNPIIPAIGFIIQIPLMFILGIAFDMHTRKHKGSKDSMDVRSKNEREKARKKKKKRF